METLFRPRLRSSDDRVASATPLTRATSSSSRTGGAAGASGVRPLLGGGLGLRAVGGQRRGAPHGRADQAPGRAARGLDFDLHGVARPERRRARGRAGQDDVARLQRDQLRQVADDLRQREQQGCGGVLLHQLAVAPDPNGDAGRVELGGGQQPGPDRGVAVAALGAHVGALVRPAQVEHAEIVRGGDRGDRGPRRRLADPPHLATDHQRDLALEAEDLGARGQLDGAAGRQRGGGLQEVARGLRGAALLRGAGGVADVHGEDGAGPPAQQLPRRVPRFTLHGRNIYDPARVRSCRAWPARAPAPRTAPGSCPCRSPASRAAR